MKELEIKIPLVEQSTYKIIIGSGILGSAWQQIQADLAGYKSFVITDENVVNAGHFDRLVGSSPVEHFVIKPAGEISKNIHTLTCIIEEMEKAQMGRDTVIIAIGGGTVGDMAGFAAAIFKRGVPVIHIPTTTVSFADSSVGGKAGVDSSVSKNAFGVFWQPSGVFIDVATLDTLAQRQYNAGLIESVKHALIADSEYFEYFEKNIDAILQRDTQVLEKIALWNCKIKGSVVEIDPTEKNQRKMLNYGHTIGHAVETASGFDLLHGEAVAVGIVAAGLIEKEFGMVGDGRIERIKDIFLKLEVPVSIPADMDNDTIIDIMKSDKKAVDRWPGFVLIDKIGHVCQPDGQCCVNVEKQLVRKILTELREK